MSLARSALPPACTLSQHVNHLGAVLLPYIKSSARSFNLNIKDNSVDGTSARHGGRIIAREGGFDGERLEVLERQVGRRL